jgi:hypothetical protein
MRSADRSCNGADGADLRGLVLVPVRVHRLSRGRLASADLPGQGDDDARRAAQVAQQEDALELCRLAEEFGATGVQPGDGVIDVVHGEHDAVQAQRAGRRSDCPAPAAAGAWYLVSSSLPWPSGIRLIAISLRMPSSPTVRSAQTPSTGPLPSSSMPSSPKNVTAASRSSTTIARLAIR